MSLPIVIPSGPISSGQSDQSPSPELSYSQPSTASSKNGGSSKRKTNKRLNTAEHRAVHNAVERARRETLNGRFLDLARLLPNLSQIRRPSKSAIVNSSIAHLTASRRHRAMASRELRLLKLEADHLRKELNEWRDRAQMPRVEEPTRGDGFSMVLHQELEAIPILRGGAYEDEEYLDDASSEGDYGVGPSGPSPPPNDHHRIMLNRQSPPASIHSPFIGQSNSRHSYIQSSPAAHQHPMISTPPQYEDSYSSGLYESQASYPNHPGFEKYPNSLPVSYDRHLQGISMGGRGLHSSAYPMLVQ